MCCPRGRLCRSALPASLLGLALIVTACGGDADANSATAAESPLGDLLGWSDYDPVEQQRQALEIERLTAECMNAEGFEYLPVDYSQGDAISEVDAELIGNPTAWGEKYGYGIVYGYETWEAGYIESNISGVDPEPTWVDPNEPYVNSLSENERQTYYETLQGKPQEWQIDEDGNEIQPPPLPLEDRGCNNQAAFEINGPSPWDTEGFSQRFDEIQVDLFDDPRLAASEAKWAECMGDGLAEYDMGDGRTVSRPDEMYTYFDMQKVLAAGQEIVPLDPATGEPVGGPPADGAYSSTMNADGTGYAYLGEQHLIAPDQLEGLRSRELAAWKQDYACQESSGVIDARKLIEQDLVDQLVAEFPDIGKRP